MELRPERFPGLSRNGPLVTTGVASRSHADVLRLVTRSSPRIRSWGGTRDKPKNVCAGGYKIGGRIAE